MRYWLLLAALCPAMALADDYLVGEWSVDADGCARTRITYTEDGRHEALAFDDGQWKTLGSGTYSRDGERLTVTAGAIEDSLKILSVDGERLVLRNQDEARMQALGAESVSFVRCPAR